MNYLLIIFILWNLFVFTLYGIDKRLAVMHNRRISEFKLILPAFVFASLGAAFGMIVFNHKTSKTKFRILIPLFFICNIVCIALIKFYTR